jgi:hypothetical protein
LGGLLTIEWLEDEDDADSYILTLKDQNGNPTELCKYDGSEYEWLVSSGDIALPAMLGYKTNGLKNNSNWNGAIKSKGAPARKIQVQELIEQIRAIDNSNSDTFADIYQTIEENSAAKIDDLIAGSGIDITGSGTQRTITATGEVNSNAWTSSVSPTEAVGATYTGNQSELTAASGTPTLKTGDIAYYQNGKQGLIIAIDAPAAGNYQARIIIQTPSASWGAIIGALSSQADLAAALAAKQNKVPAGTNGYLLTYAGAEGVFNSTNPANLPISTAVAAALNAKQDSLSTEQLEVVNNKPFTDTEKTKLSGIAAGAQVNTVTSVAGKTGAVTLAKTDVGLSNVANAAQIAQTAQITAVSYVTALPSTPVATTLYFVGE